MTNYVCCQNNDCENVELMNYVCRQKISNWECLLMKNVAGLYVADFTGSAVVSSSLFILITLLMWSKYYFLLQIGLISSCCFFFQSVSSTLDNFSLLPCPFFPWKNYVDDDYVDDDDDYDVWEWVCWTTRQITRELWTCNESKYESQLDTWRSV